MLKSLRLHDFTVFADTKFVFGKNLNILVGENGTGKTHVLKAAYCGLAALSGNNGARQPLPLRYGSKLVGVFRPDSLGRLVRRKRGRLKAGIRHEFIGRQELVCSFSRLAETEVKITSQPSESDLKYPVFLPTCELLSIYPGFVSLYDNSHLPFEETWRDTCSLLGVPLARGPREARIRQLLEPLELAMGGKLELDAGGRFYLNQRSGGSMEIHLVAEGLRKLATVARLIATGALLDRGYLFWDEPEANLNPRILKSVAATIVQLAQNGIQVFVATHSLFLMRELYLLQAGHSLDVRCFGLHPAGEGTVEVQQGKTIDDVGPLASLDEDIEQSTRYLEASDAEIVKA